jgi:hypothetical protein
MVTTPIREGDMHENDNIHDLEARLRSERPEAPGGLIERISSQVGHSKDRRASRARKAFAVAFASLILSSSVVGIALADKGGNGGGSRGNGNGDGGHPAGCVEGNGKAPSQNPNC